MKKATYCLGALAILFLISPVADAKVCALVTLGSADFEGAPPDNHANLSAIAIETCDGTVKGQVQDTIPGGFAVHINVTCLVIQGREAWISGDVKHVTPRGIFDELEGTEYVLRLKDNGTSLKDPPDQAGVYWPVVDPLPPNSCLDQPDLDLFDLVNGQVQIR